MEFCLRGRGTRNVGRFCREACVDVYGEIVVFLGNVELFEKFVKMLDL